MKRRELLGVGAVASVLLASSAANACTILPTVKAKALRLAECERQIHELVAFMNQAPGLSQDVVSEWVDRRNINVYYEYPVSENVGGSLYNYLFFREFRISGGKLDPDPIKIKEINLIRHLGGNSALQFTLIRNQFFPEDLEGCNGLFTHGDYFDKTETAFIARFFNNKLMSFRDFPEWFVE
ncbi:MAG: hypothetical protein J7498_06890 [Sphingobium sp.]|nr:hypothetical protein [Sphingobium sp.]